LVCTDARFAQTAEFRQLLDDLAGNSVAVRIWPQTEPELPRHQVEECVAETSGHDVDVVIGIGGGSCLDMAKAVSLVLTHGGPLDKYYGDAGVPGPVIPVIALPTTGGTGSEVTPVCVLSDSQREVKVGISSPYLVPSSAICDPELTFTCPPPLTASAGADALSHLIESYTAIEHGVEALSQPRVFIGKNTLSDGYATWGLGLLATSLVQVYRNPDDQKARSQVMLAANAGGFALGVGGTAAAHALQYPLGAVTHTPHGVGVGTLLPYVMRFNLPERVAEFGTIARLLGVSGQLRPDDLARAGIEAVERILAQIDIPVTLRDLGLPRDKIKYVAETGMNSTRLVENNPRKLDVDAMFAITQAAYDGDHEF
jgi:alcohol dehydrogenase